MKSKKNLLIIRLLILSFNNLFITQIMFGFKEKKSKTLFIYVVKFQLLIIIMWTSYFRIKNKYIVFYKINEKLIS